MMPAFITSPAASRTRWIDGARGIGILLVVYGHAARALYQSPAVPAWVQIGDRVIYAFHMPLFFLIAGLFVWSSLGKGRKKFVTDKLSNIVYPYFVWSLAEGSLEVAFAGKVNSPITMREILMIPVTPIEQFWFLYVLALCMALALACYPHPRLVAIVAVTGLCTIERYGTGPIGLRTLAFFPFVAIGILFRSSVLALGRNRRRAAGMIAGAGIVFAAGIMAGANGIVGGLVVALAGIGVTLALAVLLDASGAGALLASLGRASLAIYVMHTIFSAGLRIVARTLGIVVPDSLLLVATVAVGVVGPTMIWLLAERYQLTMLFGLGRTASGVRE